ncbi:hypothetical protein CLV91_2380 [Maribacter vaceletii]|uniref:Uncharacterized protein n=1 Tax=Maribacter vaceletii TaxID=1206816 RepID=A0A495E5M8_9FLAO|nr:hypothetical protein [Maribacter vaceletii]RKR12254.1 hypothetical protein CLV91_2380 [Maribacter vaceletii]
MKTILTLIFVLFIGVAAQAQNNTQEVKVVTIEKTIVTETTVESNTVARLYKRTNSTVKKALKFTTKRNKAKLA